MWESVCVWLAMGVMDSNLSFFNHHGMNGLKEWEHEFSLNLILWMHGTSM